MFHVEHLHNFSYFGYFYVRKRKIFRQDYFEVVPRGTKQRSVDNFVNNKTKRYVLLCIKC